MIFTMLINITMCSDRCQLTLAHCLLSLRLRHATLPGYCGPGPQQRVLRKTTSEVCRCLEGGQNPPEGTYMKAAPACLGFWKSHLTAWKEMVSKEIPLVTILISIYNQCRHCSGVRVFPACEHSWFEKSPRAQRAHSHDVTHSSGGSAAGCATDERLAGYRLGH